MFNDFARFVRGLYDTDDFIPLHEPRFTGNEKRYLSETIDSSFVSSAGGFVNKFERKIAEYTGAKYAVATVNGTAALHMALILAGARPGTEVITQSLTFVATCNAIQYCGAEPVFVDVDRETLGLSPESLDEFLDANCEVRDDGACWNRTSDHLVCACVPMHTFGLPARLDELSDICRRYNITLVEDAAESLGSIYKGRHTGTIGQLAALSFNGNKIITTGGGGMVLTNDERLANRARRLTTTAKVPHRWALEHDETGFNYRLPNLNAALGVAQLESLPGFIEKKRQIASRYQKWGEENGVRFVRERQETKANYWLNALVTDNKNEREALLKYMNDRQVMARPVWTPMHKLSMTKHCQSGKLDNTEWLFDRLVSVPSSVPEC